MKEVFPAYLLKNGCISVSFIDYHYREFGAEEFAKTATDAFFLVHHDRGIISPLVDLI
jgi:hypothetical protein